MTHSFRIPRIAVPVSGLFLLTAAMAAPMSFDQLMEGAVNGNGFPPANTSERIAAGPWDPVWREMWAKTSASGREIAALAIGIRQSSGPPVLALVKDVQGDEASVDIARYKAMTLRGRENGRSRLAAVMHTHPDESTFSIIDAVQATETPMIVINSEGVEMLLSPLLKNTDKAVMLSASRTIWWDEFTCDMERANADINQARRMQRQLAYRVFAFAHMSHYTLNSARTEFIRTALPSRDFAAEFGAFRASIVDAVRLAVVKQGTDAAIEGLESGTLASAIQANLGMDASTYFSALAPNVLRLNTFGRIYDQPDGPAYRIRVFPVTRKGFGCTGAAAVLVTAPGAAERQYVVTQDAGTVQVALQP